MSEALLDLPATTSGTIDRGLDSPAAQRALAKRKRLKDFCADGEESTTAEAATPTNLEDIGDVQSVAAAFVPAITQPAVSPALPPGQTPDNKDNVITIDDEKIHIELEYNPTGTPNRGLCLSFNAASVQQEGDGISMLLRAEFSLRLPTMTDLTLKIHKKKYSVWYVGGTHRIGSFINIPFIVLPSNNGETSSSEAGDNAE